MNKIIAKRINQMAREDQKMRKSHKKGVLLDIKIDKKNTAELKKIIKQYGWPVISLVGKKASFNAWLLVQHADHDRKFQKYVLNLLKTIDLKSHDVDRANIAYLTDRLLVAKKKKQIFGTQFSFDKNGKLKLNPVKNQKKINTLRKEYCLPTMEKYLKMMKDFNAKIIKK